MRPGVLRRHEQLAGAAQGRPLRQTAAQEEALLPDRIQALSHGSCGWATSLVEWEGQRPAGAALALGLAEHGGHPLDRYRVRGDSDL